MARPIASVSAARARDGVDRPAFGESHVTSILVIDDEDAVRFSLQSVLKDAGHDVATAAGGAHLFNDVAMDEFDLVITDIIMPEIDGIEVVLEIKKRHPSIKVIAISGGGRVLPQAYLDDALVLGADQTLSKPFTVDELMACVDEVIGG